jgi:hypothetical protein
MVFLLHEKEIQKYMYRNTKIARFSSNITLYYPSYFIAKIQSFCTIIMGATGSHTG